MKPTAAASTPVGSQRLAGAFHAVGLAVLICVALYFGHTVLVPIALSALFAFILSPAVGWVERRGPGRVAGVLVVALAAFALIGGFVTLATVQVRDLADHLKDYQPEIDAKMTPIRHAFDRLQRAKSNLQGGAQATTQAGAIVKHDGPEPQPQPVVVKSAAESSSLSWVPTVALPVVEMLGNGILITVLTIFLMMQREQFRDRLIRLAGRSRLSSTTRALGDAATRVGTYLLLQLGVNAALGLVVGTGLWLVGVPYFALWGMLVVVLRFVPYVGYWIVGLAAIAIAAVSHDGWTHTLLAFGLFAALDLTMANAVEPLVFSHGTGVSPVALLVAAVFWAFLWGPVGLILSTPLTVCLAVLGKHVPALGFLAILLGDEPSLDVAARFYNRLLARDYDEAAVLIDAYAADHPRTDTYDDVVLPALAQAKTDREQKDLTDDEEAAVYDATRSVLDTLSANPEKPAGAGANATPVKVIGCAVFGPADTLALRMLGDAIAPAGGELEVTTPDQVSAAVTKAEASSAKPPVVCFSTLSPGGLSQARSLMAAVRQAHPTTKLLVGRWGQTGDTTQTDKYLRSSGADDVGWSLHQTIGQLVPKPSDAAVT